MNHRFKPNVVVQKTYRLAPELAAAVKKAATRVKLTEQDFVRKALIHACDERRRPAKQMA